MEITKWKSVKSCRIRKLKRSTTKCLCPSEFRAKERASSFALKRKIADFTPT